MLTRRGLVLAYAVGGLLALVAGLTASSWDPCAAPAVVCVVEP